jgi:glycosyltransferase involved in cell wall biosynthesis
MAADPLRVLVLAPFPPRLDGHHGGSRVTAGFVTELAKRHRVALLHLGRGSDDVADDVVGEACEPLVRCELPARPRGGAAELRYQANTMAPLLAGRPRWATLAWSRACAGRLRTLAGEFRPDVVQCEYAVMTQYLPALRELRAARVLVQHEPAAARSAEAVTASLGGRRRARLAARGEERAWRRFERQSLGRVDAVVAFTEADRDALRALGARTPIDVIPFGIDIPPEALDPAGASDADRLLFVANFVHMPNVEAARRLVLDVLPLVRRERPGVTVELVGRAPPPAVEALAGEGVVVTGEVPSVTPYLDRANVVVAPLAIGGGIRVKTIEALGFGKAVVATPLAAAGLPVADGEHLRLAETDDELARAILELLADAEGRAALGRRARAWAVEHAGWDAAVDAYERLYRSLLGGGR